MSIDINSAVALRGENKQIATLLEKERDVRKSRRKSRRKGTILTLYNLAQDGTITLEIAALKAGLSESEFEKKAKEYLEK